MIVSSTNPASSGRVHVISAIDDQPKEASDMKVTVQLLPQPPSLWRRLVAWFTSPQSPDHE
jgi:hypothetical protein